VHATQQNNAGGFAFLFWILSSHRKEIWILVKTGYGQRHAKYDNTIKRIALVRCFSWRGAGNLPFGAVRKTALGIFQFFFLPVVPSLSWQIIAFPEGIKTQAKEIVVFLSQDEGELRDTLQAFGEVVRAPCHHPRQQTLSLPRQPVLARDMFVPSLSRQVAARSSALLSDLTSAFICSFFLSRGGSWWRFALCSCECR
jgi:hypothetical protein